MVLRRSSGKASVRGRKTAHAELNLTVGKLTPVLDYGNESARRGLIDDFASLISGRVDGKRKSLRRVSCGRHTVCQPAWANEHARPPRVSIRKVLAVMG